MNKFKLLVLGFGILLTESIILACLVPLFTLIFGMEINLQGIISVFYFTLLFMMYKCVVELWLFLIIVSVRTSMRKPKLKDLLLGKSASGLLMLSVLITFSVESSRSLDIFVVYALMYAPSLIMAYFIFRKWWMKGVIWISNNDM